MNKQARFHGSLSILMKKRKLIFEKLEVKPKYNIIEDFVW